MKDGFFYVKIPDDWSADIEETVKFANTWHLDPEIKTRELEGFSGYNNRQSCQVESYYLSQEYWDKYLPSGPVTIAKNMNLFAYKVLAAALRECGVCPAKFAELNGSLGRGDAMHHFGFNHYRPGKDKIGMNAHKDFGWPSVLFINSGGLQAKVRGNWIDIPAKPGHFIVNFCYAFEMFIGDESKLVGGWHRVKQVDFDRISFLTVIDTKIDEPIYKCENGVYEVAYTTSEEYIQESFDKVYSD